jgi:hypothetical protein
MKATILGGLRVLGVTLSVMMVTAARAARLPST